MALRQTAGSGDHIKNVALVGATGTLGKHILEHLIRSNKHNITILSRSPSALIPADPALMTNVNIAEVKYDEETTLIAALTGIEFLIITLSNRSPHDTQSKLITAAAKAGVQWVMPNEYGPPFVDIPSLGQSVPLPGGQSFYDSLSAVRAQITELGMKYVVLGCGFWYEHSVASTANSFGFDFGSKKLTLIDEGETKINVSTLEQCGRAVSALLALPVHSSEKGEPCLQRYRDKVCYISSFLLNQKDMLSSVLRLTGDSIEEWMIVKEPSTKRYDDGLKQFEAQGYGGLIKAMYTRTFWLDGCGDYESKGWLSNDVLGLPREDLDVATGRAVEMVRVGERYNNTA